MNASELKGLIEETDARIKDLDRLMATTPRDTTAYDAMQKSRPILIRFRNSLDDKLHAMGA